MSANGLPRGWVQVALGEVVALNPRRWTRPPNDGEPLSFVPMAAVEEQSGKLDPSQTRPWGEIKRKSYTTFEEGDVLFAKVTPCMENGKCAIAARLVGGRGAGSTEFHVMRPPAGVEAKFLLFFLLQDSFRREARSVMRGVAGLLRVPPEFIAGASFTLPPRAEQRRIVGEIEKQFTRLDAAVAALERVRAELKRYRASVLKSACEGRLVPTEAELARVERRTYEPSGTRAAPTDFTSLPKLPPGWSYAGLNQLSTMIRNGYSAKPDAEAGIPILRISAVRSMSVNTKDVRFTSAPLADVAPFTLDNDDLLFTRYNGTRELVGVCGRVRKVVGPLLHPDKLIRVKLSGPFLPAFIEIVANTGVARAFLETRIRTTAGQSGISGGDLHALPVPVAPLAEQHRIVAEVERRLSVVEEVETLVEANLKRAERLRQSILKRAFQGKLVPQDRNDEPASALLERIRAERAAEERSAPRARSKPARRAARGTRAP